MMIHIYIFRIARIFRIRDGHNLSGNTYIVKEMVAALFTQLLLTLYKCVMKYQMSLFAVYIENLILHDVKNPELYIILYYYIINLFLFIIV